MEQAKKNPPVLSVTKALKILELLNEKGTLTISEISASLKINKSTVSRLLSTLSEGGIQKGSLAIPATLIP